MDRPWTSGFDKRPVVGPLRLGLTNLDGDGQADLVHHGGPDKAILAYSADHYDGWRHELQMPDLPFGAFGENFTVEGLTEAKVCLGDIWQVGESVLQVSQPRQPCWKLARRWRIKSLALQVQESGRTGWYFRVLQEGVVAPGLSLQRLECAHPEWTVERANDVMHFDKDNLNLAAALAAIRPLAASWKATLMKRAERKAHSDPVMRLIGPNEP
ncbi:MOSC domain-containing protein [Caulifigura coniformis]|nr:MOSC domain-containing protein [Caulifigura coniformis]